MKPKSKSKQYRQSVTEQLKKLRPTIGTSTNRTTVTKMLHRIRQQGAFSSLFDRQDCQIKLLQKLYLKHGLILTGGGACPEQYDVFKGEIRVAYLRLRHGGFTISDNDYKTWVQASPEGDGMFEDNERFKWLIYALHFILRKIS